jgi:hypothetical protein
MKRTASVTAAAVVLLIGSAIFVLIAIMAVVVAVFMPSSASPNIGPPGAPSQTGLIVLGGVFYLALAGWGLATAAGILRLRPWARISILIMSALAIFVCLIPLLTVSLLPPMPGLHDATAILIVRLVMFGILGLPGAIAVWWLILFTRRRVKQQFASEPTGAAPDAPAIRPSRERPVSITVIAIVLLAGPLALLFLLVGHFVGPLGMPAWILGVEVDGDKAALFYVTLGLIELALGLGLWWMKPWARTGSVALCLFSIANSGGAVLRADALTRRLAAMFAAIGVPTTLPAGSAFFRLGIALGVVPFLVALWFLVRRKAAFATFPGAQDP